MPTLAQLLLMIQQLQHRPANENERAAAVEIARVVDGREPVFGSAAADGGALLVTAKYESEFTLLAVGDRDERGVPRALGPYQLHGVTREAATHWATAVPIAYARLRASARSCRDAPLAPYIGGCHVPAARRMSAWRMREIGRLVRAVEAGR